MNTLQRRGWITFGIDPGLKTAFARHQELAAIPSEPTFRLVIASHVLEHLQDPGMQIARLGRATVPGEWIYVSVPNLDALPEHRDWYYVLNARTHIVAFTLRCLTYLLERGGFGDITILPSLKGDGSAHGRSRLRVLARRLEKVKRIRTNRQKPIVAAIECLRRAGVLNTNQG